MIAKPINSILKKHFQQLNEAAIERAKNDFAVNISNKLKDLDTFGKVKLLSEEYDRLKDISEKSEYPYYIKNAGSADWLLDQFASRAFLLNVDDSEVLGESIYTGTYRHLIFDEQRKVQDEVPKYSYAAFIEGKIDPYLFELEKYYKIDEADYYKLRDWQSDKIIKIISYESRILISKIQQHCATIANPMEFIHAEHNLIDTTLNNVNPVAKEIKSVLSQMFIFKWSDMNVFDDAFLVECYKQYKNPQLSWKYAFPKYLNPLLKKVSQKVNHVFSNEPIILYTINKIDYWLEAVIKGRPIQQPVVETDWDKLFAGILSDAKNRVDPIIEEINNHVDQKRITQDEIKKYLISNFETYRYQYNEVKHKHYFALLRDENFDFLKTSFITNSFFGTADDVAEVKQLITDILVIHEVSWAIAGLYMSFFNTRKMDYPQKEVAVYEIFFLLNKMVLDKELYNELEEAQDQFFQQIEYGSVPFEIHFQNSRITFTNVFHKALLRLSEALDDAEPSAKILFLQSRLKSLKQRELEFNMLRSNPEYEKEVPTYTLLFKDFLQIEADFIRETKDLNTLPALQQGKAQFRLNAPALTFETALTSANATFLLQMLEDLNITVNHKAEVNPKKMGAVRGVVLAAKAAGILPKRDNIFLCKLVGEKIGLNIKKLGDSHECDDYKTLAEKYISKNYS